MPRTPALLALFALLPATALAQAEEARPGELLSNAALDEIPIEYQKETHVDFGVMELSATVEGPSMGLVDGIPAPPPREPMIRVRVSFDDMMTESAAQIR